MTAAEEVAKRTSAFQLAQLNACYSETARQKFEALYNSCVEDWQKVIAAVDSDLAACYLGKDWLTVMEHDYAPQKNSTDWLLHMKTLTACLQGGSMKHSDEVWAGWMKKPDSPAYVGLLAMNHTMNAAVFNPSAGLNDLQSVTTPPAGAMDGPTVAGTFGGVAPGAAAAATGGLSAITDEKILNQPVTIRIASTDLGAQAALDALPKRGVYP